jgi:hypothetical protein
MRLTNAAPLAFALALAACTTSAPAPRPQPAPPAGQQPPRPVPPMQPAPPPADGFRMPEIMRGPGLDGVIREGPNSLMRQFGNPRLDVSEGDMRKLQFASTACVLDVYLYPLRPGGDPQATWLEARRASDGAAVDIAACMQAMRRAR